jgi:hypothetical protein
MREIRTYGFVRGALSDGRPYRDRLHGYCALRPQLLRQMTGRNWASWIGSISMPARLSAS